jgi:hypothetical protein
MAITRACAPMGNLASDNSSVASGCEFNICIFGGYGLYFREAGLFVRQLRFRCLTGDQELLFANKEYRLIENKFQFQIPGGIRRLGCGSEVLKG